MDESRYLDLAHRTFRRILDAFDDVDIEDADAESAGDVITIAWKDGSRCVVNTQRPVRQVWLAGGDRAWHFDWDERSERWLDDKGSGTELCEAIERIAHSKGVEIAIAR
ncbi:iron donor protein CyaY [Sandaracinus amylolyticus]|uniref:iron donor protein CyaY n=1 Tax=Sandaracinus amylolyticus TaxID=927083 RepID=UPI001F015F5F|nr:iron donor protein CyaY [Sandaracinus amylolyticus]UJR81872.1 Iron-sulfur cluster assembly protein CyaY [Sandaracinus amylolyticus]